jgi:hypothetical protein
MKKLPLFALFASPSSPGLLSGSLNFSANFCVGYIHPVVLHYQSTLSCVYFYIHHTLDVKKNESAEAKNWSFLALVHEGKENLKEKILIPQRFHISLLHY